MIVTAGLNSIAAVIREVSKLWLLCWRVFFFASYKLSNKTLPDNYNYVKLRYSSK